MRATQFHEFAGQILDRFAVGPIAPAPRMRIRPVAAREVAEVLADLGTAPAAGRVPDLAGPQIHELPDLMARVLRARKQRRWLVPVRLPGRAGRAMAEGGLLPGAAARLGTCTFDAWLAEINEIGGKPPSDQIS